MVLYDVRWSPKVGNDPFWLVVVALRCVQRRLVEVENGKSSLDASGMNGRSGAIFEPQYLHPVATIENSGVILHSPPSNICTTSHI